MAKQIAKTSCNARSLPQKAPTPEHLVGAVLSSHKPKIKPRGEMGGKGGKRASPDCQEHKGSSL